MPILTKLAPSTRLRLGLGGLLVLAVLVRLYAWWQAPRLGFVADEAEYFQAASVLADGRGWSFLDNFIWLRSPLYPLFLAGLLKFFGPGLIAIRLVQIALSVGTVYLLYRLALRSAGRRVALIAAGLAAVAWPFAVLSYLVLSETLFLFLFLLGLNFLSAYLATQEIIQDNTALLVKKGWRQPVLLLGAGGVSLGLAALTRGQVLTFLPFIALWLWLQLGRQWRKTVLAFGVLVLVFGLTVSPWVLRNWVSFGRPLIDTTGGYNFYLGALHNKDEAQIYNNLSEVPNQAEREALAYHKGLEILLHNLADWLGKSVGEALNFWQLNFGGEERLTDSYTKGAISPAWLLPDQLLGDVLYILVGVLALVGWPLMPGRAGVRSFIGWWLLYNVLLAFGFFAVSRFRLPVYYFALIPAAYVLVYPRQTWQQLIALFTRNRFAFFARLSLPILFLIIVLPSWSPDQAWVGWQEWSSNQHVLEGDALRKAGRYQEALQAYAQGSTTNPSTKLGIGLTLALQDQTTQAEALFETLDEKVVARHLALGWLYLREGKPDYARSEFRNRGVSLDPTADNWAWQNLPTTPLADNWLKLGEFDWGYVDGFQPFERADASSPYFRWTAGRGESGTDRARLLFPITSGAPPRQVILYLNGFRPAGLTSPSVEVFVNSRSIGRLQTTNQWQTFSLSLPPDLPPGQSILIELAPSSTFVPGPTSRRELGVMVQWAKLQS